MKGAIISALSGVVATRDDIQDLIRTLDKRFEEQRREFNDRFEAHNQNFNDRFEALNQNFNDRFEAQNQNFNSRFEMLIREIADTNRNVALLKEFNEKRLGVLDKNMKRVLKFVEEIRDRA